MDPVRIPVQGELVGFVQALRAQSDGQIYAEVTWELRAGRIQAGVLNDQVLVDPQQSDLEIQEVLTKRGTDVAAQYLAEGGPGDDVLEGLKARLVNR
jgi:hypothetical protein